MESASHYAVLCALRGMTQLCRQKSWQVGEAREKEGILGKKKNLLRLSPHERITGQKLTQEDTS